MLNLPKKNVYNMHNDNYRKSIEFDFFKSATKNNFHNTIEDILIWIEQIRKNTLVDIQKIPFSSMKTWFFDKENGSLNHITGSFFKIEGIHINTNWGLKNEWEQPIINQPEIGILGILAKKIDGTLHFLLQAKIEPGNINVVQISPTLQATKSNYLKKHLGKSPEFIDYFIDYRKSKVLLDQLQSEQGARFLKKRNRNIIIEIDEKEEINHGSNFKWFSLRQIKELLMYDNLINMDTRTVISGISYDVDLKDLEKTYFEKDTNFIFVKALLTKNYSLNSLDSILSWITNLKTKYELNTNKKSIFELKNWSVQNDIIQHDSKKYFSIIALKVKIENREVNSWDQPMVKPENTGIIGFIIKKINGVYHFLVQAKLEIGNFDIIELAPTVQCITGNYRIGQNEYAVPFIEHFINPKESEIIMKNYQSEEGGRFYNEENLNLLIEKDDEFNDTIPDNYCWMTFNQLTYFIKFNNYVNISARSLIAALKLVK
jgi:oxidase EvaA